MLVFFDILFIVIKNNRMSRFIPKFDGFRKEVQESFFNYNPKKGLNPIFKKKLTQHISKVKHLVTMQSVYDEVELYKEELGIELSGIVIEFIEVYKKKSLYEQAYYAYVISSYEYPKTPRGQFIIELMSFLDSHSLYVFSNTMNAFYNFNNVTTLLNAIDKCNERGVFYNSKLFVDGLLTFRGDKNELADKLIERFDKYTPYMQENIINFLRLASLKKSDFCYRVLVNQTYSEEVQFAIMRYFGKYPNHESKQYFLDILNQQESSWVKVLLSIQSLEKYKTPDVFQTIKTKITDVNWFVRTSAVKYLYTHNMSKEELDEILRMNDKYTNEALLYQCQDDEDIMRYVMSEIDKLSLESQDMIDLDKGDTVNV